FMSISFICLALFSAASNILLIPQFGLAGAAYSTAGSIIILNLISFLFIKKQFKLQPFERIDGLIILLTLLLVSIDLIIPAIDNHILSIFTKSTIILMVFTSIVLKLNLSAELRNILSIKSLTSKINKS
ncbi:MAG: polysaccharide biosynthesis C-terminal domain-containing protein, partial [Bacteroidota bacterium]